MTPEDLQRAAVQLDQLQVELRRVVVGQDRVVERILASLLARGHCLLEGVPGLGKTLMLSTLARVIGGSFSRIQFTADLIPSDVVGTRIFRPSTESFDVEPGPVFANVVLADEVNRAPAKAQSALLEVMAEGHVSLGGKVMAVPDPFLVLATQNPIDSEGVYPLPEAQRDRFLMRVPVEYPTAAEELEVMRRDADGIRPEQADRILDPEDVAALQAMASSVHVPGPVADYALRLVLATRDPAAAGLGRLAGALAYGASPRASLGLLRAARALAIMRGRGHVVAQDVYDVAYDILNHRLSLSFSALANGMTVDDVLIEVLRSVPAPAVGSGLPDRAGRVSDGAGLGASGPSHAPAVSATAEWVPTAAFDGGARP